MNLDNIYEKMGEFGAKIKTLFDRLERFENSVQANNNLIVTNLENRAEDKLEVAVLRTRFDLVDDISKNFKESFEEIAATAEEIRDLVQELKDTETDNTEVIKLINALENHIRESSISLHSKIEEIRLDRPDELSIREILYELSYRNEKGIKINPIEKGWAKAKERIMEGAVYVLGIIVIWFLYTYVAGPAISNFKDKIRNAVQDTKKAH